MPIMSGTEMIKEIRKINKDIPIFVLSGLLNLEDEMKELGINDFFQKPVVDHFKIKYTISRYF